MAIRLIRRHLLTAGSVVILAVSTACGSTSTAAVSAATTASAVTASTATNSAAMPVPAGPTGPHNQADIAFAQQMIGHHEGAVSMSELAATRAPDPAVKALAVTIGSEQAPQIKEMAGWLAAWAPSTDMNGMPATTSAAMDMQMPGMMTAAQMSALAAASGPAFDKLFLQLMIVHHQGALQMAATEDAQGSNPVAKALAASITASQTDQRAQMQKMLTSK